MTKPYNLTRRDFLKGSTGMMVTLGLTPTVSVPAQAQDRSKVVVIRHSKVIGHDGKINGPILQSMVDEAVQTLGGQKEALKAWQTLFKKTDIVGIKTNVWRYLATPEELEQTLRRRLIDSGIPETAIGIDDRGVLHNPLFGRTTALINVRPLRIHYWSGVGSCLKNYIMFVPNPSAYHGEACSDLGKIWTLPLVKGKTRLNILVALTPQFFGRGPHSFDLRYIWAYKGLIVGTDPVAVDAVGAELLRQKRLAFFGDDRELDVQPIHIAVADKKYRLGTSDLRRIEVIKLGWMEQDLLA